MDDTFEDIALPEVEDDPLEVDGLSAAIADREARLATMREELAQARQELQDARGESARALDRYREALLAAHPDLPHEMLSGDTLDELEASKEAALALVEDVRKSLGAPPKIPAGAPGRAKASGPQTAADKIRLGLSLR